MATVAQITANRANSNSSTGPNTPEGKQTSAQNAVITSGLFTVRDFILPDENETYIDFTAGYKEELAPVGCIENDLTAEIISAAWRLRRCRLVEATPSLPETEWKAIDRARSIAQNSQRRAITELRRIQTERHTRKEIYPEGYPVADLGLSAGKEIATANQARMLALLALEKSNETEIMSLIDNVYAKRPARNSASPCKTAEPPVKAPSDTPRNALCPCKSGQKYKRCCGVNAAPVLGNSLGKAA